MSLVIEVGLGPGHTVLDGDPVLLKRGGAHPQFSAHVCCGQTAEWVKMPLGIGTYRLRLGPGGIYSVR